VALDFKYTLTQKVKPIIKDDIIDFNPKNM